MFFYGVISAGVFFVQGPREEEESLIIVIGILAVLAAIAVLINFPIYASFISVPVVLVRRVLSGVSSGVTEVAAQEEEA